MKCTRCGAQFEPTAGQAKKHWWYCPDCRSLANKESRARRFERGTYSPAPGNHPPGYHLLPHVRKKARIRERAASQKRWRNPEERAKKLARGRLQRAVAAGKILREACQSCGNPQAEAHHNDYSKPFEIEWLCVLCHRKRHSRVEPPAGR